MLHYPKDKGTGDIDYTKSPTFRVKIPFWDGKFKCEVYNVQSEMIFPKDDLSILDVVPKGSEVKLILQCGGIWFANGKFGVTWKLFQAIVKPKMSLKGKCHIKLDEEEKTKIVAQVIQTDVDGDGDGDADHDNVSAVIEDEDDDEVPSAAPVRVASVPKPAPAAAAAAVSTPAVAAGGDAASKKKIVRKV
jgi:hypothetical protein